MTAFRYVPLSACQSTAAVPYLLEVDCFRVEAVRMMEAVNALPSTRTRRYVIVAGSPPNISMGSKVKSRPRLTAADLAVYAYRYAQLRSESMGAWSADTFGNDTACDWSYGLEKVDDLSLVQQSLEAVLDVGDGYLDSDIACQGLAACEVIARLKGNWGLRNPYTKHVDKWVQTHKIEPPENLVQAALAVIDRVLAPRSELLELWEDANPSEWRVAVDDLRNRVGA